MPDHRHPSHAGPAKKLLVADDSLTIQKVIRLALSNEGYEIQAVSEGNDAIQQITLFRPDVVLIDVALPGQNAFEVKRETNSHGDLSETRFVLMSSAFEKVDEEQVREVSFHGRLTKPFDPAHLRQVLQEVLAQVAAKRMEPTSILQRPVPPPSVTPAPQAPRGFPAAPPAPIHADDLAPDLWGEQPVSSIGQLPQVPPPVPPKSSEETDIRQLTESTIRISGLDDFQWNVQEPAAAPPSALPLVDAPSLGHPSDADDFQVTPPPPVFPPPPLIQSEDPTLPSGGRFEIAAPAVHDNDFTAEIERTGSFAFGAPSGLPEFTPPPGLADPIPAFTPPPPSDGAYAPATPAGVSQEQLQEWVKREVETLVQARIAELLPEITERVVKQEIHKLLKE